MKQNQMQQWRFNLVSPNRLQLSYVQLFSTTFFLIPEIFIIFYKKKKNQRKYLVTHILRFAPGVFDGDNRVKIFRVRDCL